jgi:hypothetical protein
MLELHHRRSAARHRRILVQRIEIGSRISNDNIHFGKAEKTGLESGWNPACQIASREVV